MAILTVNYSNINPEEMAASIGLKAKHIPMLIGSFLEESSAIMNTLEESISSMDYSQIKSKAHTIKGSSGNLRFSEIYEMAKEMEFAASDSNKDFDYKGHFDAIKSAIATIPN